MDGSSLGDRGSTIVATDVCVQVLMTTYTVPPAVPAWELLTYPDTESSIEYTTSRLVVATIEEP